MKKVSRTITLGLVGTMLASSLSGCGVNVREDVTKYSLVPPLTSQEVIDYYAESLKYDSVITRNLDVHETTYELKEVTGEKKDKVVELTNKAQSILGNMEYEYTDENAKVISPDTFHYIKSYLNGNKIDNGEIQEINGALGYYFVDVKYDLTTRSLGTFTQKTNLLGIDGAFVKDPYNIDIIDSAFLEQAAIKLNDYYVANNISKVANFDKNSGTFYIDGGTGVNNSYLNMNYSNNLQNQISSDVINESTSSEIKDTSTETEEISGNLLDMEIPQTGTDGLTGEAAESDSTESSDSDTSEDEVVTEVIDNSNFLQSNTYTNVISNERKCNIDIDEFNEVVGSSFRMASYMPVLTEVYNIPVNEGQIGGIGIYGAGGNGLTLFGYDRSQLSGELTLRYVFKDTVDGSGEIVGTNIYPVRETLNNGFTSSNSKVLIPDFLTTEFEMLLERADRATIDKILPSLISGDIYEDMGFGVTRGYESNHVNLLKNMSTIRQVIARDTEKNAYLVEIETTRVEGPKDVDCYGTYRDKYYIVIQQNGGKFIITDQVKISRQLVKEPSITPDSATEKRIVALGLAGEVKEESKEPLKQLVNDLYKAGTVRLLNGPKEVTYKGETVNLEKGMYDCFNSDVTMLSSEDKEYMNASIRTLLIKYGIEVPTIYSGTVTEWLGGYDNQVEFTTEELVYYEGRNEGVYMTVYYLASCMNDVWVIDERTVIEHKTVEGADLQDIQNRINQ